MRYVIYEKNNPIDIRRISAQTKEAANKFLEIADAKGLTDELYIEREYDIEDYLSKNFYEVDVTSTNGVKVNIISEQEILKLLVEHTKARAVFAYVDIFNSREGYYHFVARDFAENEIEAVQKAKVAFIHEAQTQYKQANWGFEEEYYKNFILKRLQEI